MLHGPEIIDSGSALRLISYFQRRSRVTAVLGGTMGRVALIDAGMQDLVSISPRRRPSQSIQDLEESSDLILLLNLAKSRESGHSFGAMVARAAGEGKPLIQIDCGGGFVCLLRGTDEDSIHLAEDLASHLGLDLLPHHSVASACQEENGIVKRTLFAVYPGELISVNGTVIGRAAESRVEIVAREGRIVDLKGAEPKEHGLEKLGLIHLEEAIIRSGSIRRTAAEWRMDASLAGCEERRREAALIDHCAEDSFEAALGAGVAVCVGDDTTAIAGDILSRLGVPVIGIVDEDLDRLCPGMAMMPGSIVFRVQPGYDDVVGRLVRARIFEGGQRIRITRAELAERIREIAGSRLMKMELIGQKEQIRAD